MYDIKENSNALDESIKSDHLENLTIDILESISDSVFYDGLLKDIPIVSIIYNLTKTGLNINDKLFLKKVLYFLSSLKDIPHKKRTEMVTKINDDKTYRIKVGEKLLYILDKSDDHEKAILVGKLFSAFITEMIDYNDFLKLAKVVEISFLHDLLWFVKNDWETLSIESTGEYVSWGLFEIEPISLSLKQIKGMTWDDEPEYKIEGGQLQASISLYKAYNIFESVTIYI